jgi:hypothetical protein
MRLVLGSLRPSTLTVAHHLPPSAINAPCIHSASSLRRGSNNHGCQARIHKPEGKMGVC